MDDDHFKQPSLDTKIKFIPKKAKPQDPPEDAVAENTPDFKVPAPETSSTPAAPSISKSAPPPKTQLKCPYTEPKWSAVPDTDDAYTIEMLKGGQIVETVAGLERRPFWLIGKLPDNHIVMAHPTISRFHAVLQYRPEVVPKAEEADAETAEPTAPTAPTIEKGWYVYDLNSTHGSFVNKMKIPAKTYVRVRVGYLLTFGGSTRRLILQGPDYDAEAESELSITEMKEQKRLRQEALVEAAKAEAKRKEAEGVSWGMAEDADAETDLSVNPYASTNNEELYLQDPKKTLRGYFEREGLDLEYKVDELAVGSFVCKIELPISDSNGRDIVAEVAHKGKKKDCVLQAAMEACRILDRHGVLRQSHHESRKRKIEHSDSDGDDEFFDRTGDVARKRSEKEAVQQTHAFSYEELLEQEREIVQKMADVDAKIDKYQQLERQHKQRASAEDDLDDFMTNMSRDNYDKTDIRRLRVEAANVKKDHAKLQRLIKIAQPNDLPALIVPDDTTLSSTDGKKKLVLPLFGKRGGAFKFGQAPARTSNTPVAVAAHADDVEEHDDVDEAILPAPTASDKDDPPKSIEPHVPPVSEVPTPVEVEASEPTTVMAESVPSESEKPTKKKRSRPRQRIDRNQRENVDYDECAEMVSSEKYSTWVPPQGQTGDGSTTLNDKYGY